MGQYRSAVITDAGQALLADAISGSGTVTFSAVKTSSYAYPQGTNIAGLTDLQDIVQTVTPFSVQVFNDTMLQVSTRFDNSDVTSAYLIQTIGAYAQIGDNDPVLFAVVQANTPDQMPVQSSVSPSAFIYNIQITVQQASQITVTVNPAGTATVQDILTLSAQKVDVNGGELAETETIFDDSGSVSGITSFPAFLATFLSKTKTGIFLRNLKAGLQFVLHVGSIVNNCVTDNAELPLSAAQGKVLMDGKAPNNHASSATTYGPGNANQYGHVKVNDAYTSSAGNAAAGVAASSYALAQAYTVLNTKQNKVGELVFETIADKSTTSGNSTQVFALSLTAGTWLIESQVTWIASATGRRIQSIRQGDYYNSPMLAENSNMASEEGTTSQNCVGIVTITTTQNITVWVTQSSGGNLNVGGTVKAIRFK